MYENIIFEKDPETKVATITFNRPEKMNTMSQGMWSDLKNALVECDRDPAVHAIILTGSGRAFCAGANLGGGGDTQPRVEDNRPHLERQWEQHGRTSVENHRLFREMTKPVIAAVNGWALGRGLEIVNMCDFVIASEQAQFGGPEIRHGSSLDTLMPWNIGPQWARYLLLSGGTINAQTAERIKLALKTVPHDQLMPEAKKLAHTLAKIPPMAMQLNKRMIDGIMNIAGMGAGIEYAGAISMIAHASAGETALAQDGRRLTDIMKEGGVKAFLEARDAPHRELDAEQRVFYR